MSTPKRNCKKTEERGDRKSSPLFQKGVDDLLLMFHKFLTFLKPIGFAFDVNSSTMVQNLIEYSGGTRNVSEDKICASQLKTMVGN